MSKDFSLIKNARDNGCRRYKILICLKKQFFFIFSSQFPERKTNLRDFTKTIIFIIAENDKVYVINIGGLTLVHCPNTVYTGAEKLLGSTNKYEHL